MKPIGYIVSDALRLTTGTDAFNPDNFRKQFKKGFASPSLFKFKLLRMPNIFSADITNPAKPINTSPVTNALDLVGLGSAQLTTGATFLENSYNSIRGLQNKDLTFSVSKTQLPNKIIESFKISYNGPGWKKPREINDDSLQIEVISSGDYWEHEMLIGWQHTILNYGKTSDNFSYDVSYHQDIVTEADLVLYNVDGEVVYTVHFDKLWPEMVGGESFDWSKKDSIVSFPVSFNFSTYTVEMSGGTNPFKNNAFIADNIINYPKF